MSQSRYLVCHQKKLMVYLGDDSARRSNVWSEVLDALDEFLDITYGYPLEHIHDDDVAFDKTDDYDCINADDY